MVRRIFEAYANGASPRAIAATLNEEGIPGPRGRDWIDTTIRGQVDRGTGLLNNELYIGRLIWNRCSYIRDPSTGKRLARLNPKEEWEESTDESLRIIDDALWQRVKAEQTEVRTAMARDENGVALNRARRAQHLLSGLLFSVGRAYEQAGRRRCRSVWRRIRQSDFAAGRLHGARRNTPVPLVEARMRTFERAKPRL